jgi:hypothetical protein
MGEPAQLTKTSPLPPLRVLLMPFLLRSLPLPLPLPPLQGKLQNPASVFGSAQERQLLAWVLLWWKYPAAMRMLRKVSVVGAAQSLPIPPLKVIVW